MDTSHKLLSTCQKGLDELISKLEGFDLEKLQCDMEELNFKYKNCQKRIIGSKMKIP